MAAALLTTPVTRAATITRVDRGIHDGFELLIIHCDTLPQFQLEYDRVLGVVRLELNGGKLSAAASKRLSQIKPGVVLRGATADRSRGLVTFRVPAAVHIRDYLVAAPPALILDFSSDAEVRDRLPFELDRDRYLKLSGSAERGGQLDLALRYIELVREWTGSDIALTHRAGVIQQRLGRWDLALETLAKSAELAEFAADAHARRTMVYFAKGDTAASGREWAGFFHRREAEPRASDAVPVETVVVVQATPVPFEKPSRPSRLTLPRILKAGGAGDASYLYYGWGFMGVGLLSLMGVILGGRRARRAGFSASQREDPVSPLHTASDLPTLAFERLWSVSYELPRQPPLTPPLLSRGGIKGGVGHRQPGSGDFAVPVHKVGDSNVAPPPIESVPPRGNGDFQSPSREERRPSVSLAGERRLSVAVHKAGDSNVAPPPRDSLPRQQAPSARRARVPVEQIVQLAETGSSEADIAHHLMVGRDEVTMVLNLSRLARRGAVGRDD